MFIIIIDIKNFLNEKFQLYIYILLKKKSISIENIKSIKNIKYLYNT